MFLLYHSEGYNICEMVLHECYVNDLHTTACSGMLGHHITTKYIDHHPTASMTNNPLAGISSEHPSSIKLQTTDNCIKQSV
jgi:hypothetical protein